MARPSSPSNHPMHARRWWLVAVFSVGCVGTLGTETDDRCISQCEGRQCGDDGCGGSCGVCDDGAACDPVAGICAYNCGNGILDDYETCDPQETCPTECDDGNVCTEDTLIGSLETCSLQCDYAPITACVTGDRCCAPGCNGANDGDCEPVCGNGIVEGDETCDGSEGLCPVVCDDGDPCTEDALVGSMATCDLACEATPIPNCLYDQARGVRIAGISIDQGVRIPVVESGTAVEPGERIAPLVPERPALVRADWSLPDGPSFAARNIRAVLTLRHADGSTEEIETIQRTEHRDEYRYDNLRDGYVWRLDSEQVKQGTRYSVELFEVDGTRRQDPLPMPPPRFPAERETDLDLGIEGEPTTLRVVLVPVHHDLGPDCEPAPDLTATVNTNGARSSLAGGVGSFGVMPELQFYRERLMAMNPVSDVDIVLHDPIRFTGNATVTEELLTELRQLRDADGAEPWEFYYGVTEPCDGGSDEFGGVAYLANNNGFPTIDRATYRVAWGQYYPNGREASVLVHEIGHQQGRRHIDCGDPENIEPDYPNSTGDIDVFGWDIFTDDAIVAADEKDYMSYCRPRWVSLYGWNQVYPWIAEVNSWERRALLQVPRRMLYATVDPGRWHAWWTGTASDSASEEGLDAGFTVQFYRGSELLEETSAGYRAVPESDNAFSLAIPIPTAWDQVTHIAWTDGTSQSVVSIDAVRQIR